MGRFVSEPGHTIVPHCLMGAGELSGTRGERFVR